MPSNSHYIAAVADDDEVAAQADGEQRRTPPKLTEWSPEAAALAAAVDRLGELIRASIAQGGRKPPKLQPYPRPVTALDRVKQRRRLQKHQDVVARVLPHKRPAP